jgi:predicted O-methyltransferase YrrM
MMKCEEPSKHQNDGELKAFIALLGKEQVKSYLEIGSKIGCSLWKIGTSLPAGSRIVSVELPHGKVRFEEELPHLQQCIDALNAKGYDAHLIVGDSTLPDTVEQVYKFGPFDACFIDANHTVPFVRADWKNYSKVARIVALHDINHTKPVGPPRIPIEVKTVWEELKRQHRYCEIKHDANVNGIGVLWL